MQKTQREPSPTNRGSRGAKSIASIRVIIKMVRYSKDVVNENKGTYCIQDCDWVPKFCLKGYIERFYEACQSTRC